MVHKTINLKADSELGLIQGERARPLGSTSISTWDSGNIFGINPSPVFGRVVAPGREIRLTVDNVYDLLGIPDMRIFDRDIEDLDSRIDHLDLIYEESIAASEAAAQAARWGRC